MRICPAQRWMPEKSTRINCNWHRVVLQDKIMPELEIVAKAQAIYDMGMGIPPATRVIKDGLTGKEIVAIDDHDSYYANGWDDLLVARAIILKKPENLPKWVINQSWDNQFFRKELNKYVNAGVSSVESPVLYWLDLRSRQAIKWKKAGPEAVLALTHNTLIKTYCNS